MQPKFHLSFNLLLSCIGLLLLFLLEACSARLNTRGNLPNEDMLANIEIGRVDKNQVFELIGSPSTTELFDGESWYYVSERTSTKAFLSQKQSVERLQ